MKHEVKVVRIGPVSKHPDADTLGITEIDGYTVIVRLSEWEQGKLGVYVEPDYVVPAAPWSAFLGESDSKRRIRVKKLRGIYSQGLLLKLDELGLDPDLAEGTDVMEQLGIIRYEPPEPGDPRQPGKYTGNPGEPPHPTLANIRKYDLESFQKYNSVLDPDEIVVVTEKIHGENARYAWRDDRLWVGSRNRWVSQEEGGFHWITVRDNPWIESWCKAYPNLVLFGESFGGMAKMAYGVAQGSRGFRAFDVYDTDRGEFLGWDDFHQVMDPGTTVPTLYIGPLGGVNPRELAEGKSTMADHIREGVVVKPLVERYDRKVGRVALKCVGNGYLERL